MTRHTSKKGAKYVHDFAADDHVALSMKLARFKRTRVVLSYYSDPLLENLYPEWSRLDSFGIAKSMVNSGMRDDSGRTEAPEVLLINGPVIDDGGLF